MGLSVDNVRNYCEALSHCPTKADGHKAPLRGPAHPSHSSGMSAGAWGPALEGRRRGCVGGGGLSSHFSEGDRGRPAVSEGQSLGAQRVSPCIARGFVCVPDTRHVVANGGDPATQDGGAEAAPSTWLHRLGHVPGSRTRAQEGVAENQDRDVLPSHCASRGPRTSGFSLHDHVTALGGPLRVTILPSLQVSAG